MSEQYDMLESALEAIATQPTNHAFALCKLPNSEEFHLTWQPNEASAPEMALSDIGHEAGFVVVPFNESYPICLIRGEMQMGRVAQLPHKCPQFSLVEYMANRDAYTQAFARCKKALLNGKVTKVVLSKREDYECRGTADIVALFAEACRNSPQQYVALWHTAQTGFWIVATPEPLLLAYKGRLKTVALAGTRWKSKDTWDTKNREEQAMVTNYIAKALAPYVDELTIEGPSTVYAGQIAHLCTSFSAKCGANYTAGAVLSALHPTPAVCGLPKAKAKRMITEVEKHERAYYTGFSGLVRSEGCIDCYVTLRCMSLSYQGDMAYLRLYAGGGLLPQSDEADEWEELGHKLNTMRCLLWGV